MADKRIADFATIEEVQDDDLFLVASADETYNVKFKKIIDVLAKLVDAVVVTTSKIKNGAVTSEKIAEDAVTETKIADNSISSNHIKDGAVTFDQIASGAVRASRLGQYAVTADAIAFDAVEAEKIKNGAVTSEKIAEDAVTETKIADNSIDYNHLKDGSVHPDILDREYLRFNNVGSLPGSSFHYFLVQNADELAEPYKKMHVFISRGDGVLTTPGVGRCIGFYVGSGWFQFKNLNTSKTYNVAFDEDEITDIEEVGIKGSEIDDYSIPPEKFTKNYVEYCSSTVRSYSDLDSIIANGIDGALYRVDVSGLSPFHTTVGEGYFTALASSERGELTITNQTTGEMWLYKEGTEELVALKQNGGTDGTVGDIQKVLSLMVGGV